ncbi:hypothetical protein ACP70R_038317 [Stipagrostis hirtigluma subsp. patula]
MATPRRARARAYSHVVRLLLVLLLTCCLPRRGAAQPAATGEAQLLLRIKRAWGDPPVLAAWNASAAAALCAWPYVACDGAGRVTSLTLQGANLAGPLPGDISGLSGLTYLDVSSNRLTGAIPAELGLLTGLQTLWLANNTFDAGVVPASFKSLTNMTSLWLAQCNLVGAFPSFVAEMAELEILDISVNSLTGSLPAGIWSLKKLQKLDVYANSLTGDLVVNGFAAMNLTEIDVSMNKLTGTIPEVFGSLQNLTMLNLFQNNFSGEIPASIGRLPSLSILRLDTNKLNGTLPPELGKHSPALAYVEADDNQLTGGIPEGLCDGGQFKSLTASRNRLNGSIPAGLANCASLTGLQLDSNDLSGEVPEALWTATQMGTVLLRNNRLTGSLPAMMYKNLTTLHIEGNQFGGSIPAAAATLQVFTAGNNQFSGEIPASLGDGMPMLQTLNLSGNQLSGGIPRSVAKLRQLTQMDMSRNQLSGEVPEELGAMPVLNVLDLSVNKLSGNIPPALVKPNLNSLNLSSNQLSGQVPAGLATAVYDRSFLDNPGLCTAAVGGSGNIAGVRSCAAGSLAGSSSGGVSPGLRTGLLAAGAALLLIAVAFAFFVIRDIKKRRRLARRDDWKLTPFVQALDFGEAAILRGLTEENLVGRGGSGRVYRVTYTNRRNGSAGVVAVKQIRSAGTLDEKLEREFESEASILGNVRHNNIVKLVCCLSSAEAKLLVYDYMDNGSLDKWLHGDALAAGGRPTARSLSARRAPMDWPTRLRVAIGAAQGLCYMHHECTPPIVHRDVKTSNILLDSEFRAKVADFGLARMLVRAGAPDTMSAVAGSFGYMAPECAYTRKVNEKVDVYSFGVVLLELTTGKTANDGGEHGCLAEWARHHYQSGGSIPDATDRCIRYAGYSDEIEAVFRLGVMCTCDLPSSRPTMKDVLQILLKCSEQTHQKAKTEHTPEYEAAPLLLPQRGSRRKQLSNGTEIGMEEKSDFDSIV